MKGIFTICKYWQGETCKDETLKNLHREKAIKGKSFKWPDKDELNRLNEICLKCENLFPIKEQKCPFCGNKDLQLLGSSIVNTTTVYIYECAKCGNKLTSTKKFY